MARPNKYETHVAPRLGEVADWVRNGATDEEIIKRLQIGKSAFYEYKREFPEFSDTLKNTREEVDGRVENALLQAALNGNTAAQIFWLKNRRPKVWRDKPIEDAESVNGENSIVIERKVVDLTKGKQFSVCSYNFLYVIKAMN